VSKSRSARSTEARSDVGGRRAFEVVGDDVGAAEDDEAEEALLSHFGAVGLVAEDTELFAVGEDEVLVLDGS
jgi:hypothetical protein